MADPFSPLTGGLVPQHRDHDISVPSYSQNYDFSPGYNDPQHTPHHYAFIPPLQQQSPSSGQRLQPQHAQYQHPYQIGGLPSASYMGNPSAMFQYGPTGTRAWPALPPQNYRPESNAYPRFNDERRVDEMFSNQDISRRPYPDFGFTNYVSPPGHPSLQWPQQSPRTFARRPHRPVPPDNSFPSDPFGFDTAFDGTHNLEDLRTNETLHPDLVSRRSLPTQRPYRRGSQELDGQERRHPFRPAEGPTPVPVLGPSPRNSNRRSFERYSTDLPNGAPETNGPMRSPASRATDRLARRQRTVGHLSFRRISSQMDHPNVPSTEQLRELREKLRHLLPSELPEASDTMCDICQKDYSTKHVDPSEDVEVAIQLPCKHVFGEHCINTWFETCKKHKNKITCPMCRKLLIEPRPRESAQSPQQLLERLNRLRRAESGRPFLEGMSRAMVEGRVAGEPSAA